jgi:hypothetical protein
VRRRGSFGPRTGVALRILTPAVLGLGAWFLAVLVAWCAWPAAFMGDLLVTVPPIGAAIGLGAYLAWVHRDWAPRLRRLGLAVTLAGAFVGAWVGFFASSGPGAAVTTMLGAVLAANVALVTLDIATGTTADG